MVSIVITRAAFLVVCGVAWVGSAATADGKRPNILFIYSDDQRYDAMSVVQREQGGRGRFPWLKTPNMDRLAAEGVRFRNAFVTDSLCAPSRAVNLTGLYNHLNGVASNFRSFPADNETHATLLRAAGYTTAYIGKWHMGSQRERPGFDYHASFIGHARYMDPEFVVDGVDTPMKGWIDDISTDYAVAFMRRQKVSSKPWSMVVGFKAPHGPFTPPERAKNRFAGEQARAVPNLGTPTPYMGDAVKHRAADAAGSAPDVPVRVNLDYFRCVSAEDECLGRLLDALDETGFASNTIVIYTSDNGFYLGEHGLGDKRSAYDESLRVPFLVRDPTAGPGARGRVADEMVLNLDLVQTLLDYANLPAPQTLQGKSWRPLLTGHAEGWRRSWFYEYFAEKQKACRVPDITSVRTEDAKLILYADHPEWSELFDLKADPYETKNLFGTPENTALRMKMEAEYARLSHAVNYRVPDYTDRPDWWGKPGGPDWKPENIVDPRLCFEAQKIEGGRVPDSSGKGNHGQAHEVTLTEGRNGRAAWRFSGQGHMEVPKAKTLDPSGGAWTAEVVAKASQPDGVLLARGGKSLGYALWLKHGCPVFTVTVGNKAVSVSAPHPLKDWATVTGVVDVDCKARLFVNGKPEGAARLEVFIQRDPNDSMQIGADLGSPVVEPPPPKFVGLIESVRLFSGEAVTGQSKQ